LNNLIEKTFYVALHKTRRTHTMDFSHHVLYIRMRRAFPDDCLHLHYFHKICGMIRGSILSITLS
jgi:hypothetical protein